MRTPSSGESVFKPLFGRKGLPDEVVLERNSLDGYLFLRFFKLLICISLVGCAITWPILFPINATGGGGQQQLDILNFSNVVDVNRYYAHALVAWVFLGFITLAVARERMVFIGLRQAYFCNSERAGRLTSRTILFMGIPKEFQSEQGLRSKLGPHVRKVWLVTNCKDLEEQVQDRTKASLKLEGAQVKISKLASKNYTKAEKEGKQNVSEQRDPSSWIDSKKEPTHRLRPLIGKKVNTIQWGRQEIPQMTKSIVSEQQKHQAASTEIVSSAFVEFSSQATAQQAYQFAAKGLKKQYEPRYIDVQPSEIIWKNLNNTYATRKLKLIIASTIVGLIIIFWTPIIAFVGLLTNINYIVDKVPFLSFINDIPTVILGVVTGLLPALILALCIILVPILFRLLAKLGGEPTTSAVELKTQSWYFAFQVIQVFLMTTFTSGASAVTTQIIDNPSSAPTLLAKNLPKASNFYISYFLLYGLAQAGAQFLCIAPLLIYVILGKFLDSTPRKKYNRFINLAGLGWGSEYPKWTNLGVIAISYSCIAPLVLGFATIGFTILYLAFRYKWLFILDNQTDMKGEAYVKALQHLMTGVYLSTICLIGLFGIETGTSAAAAGPLALMVVFLVAAVTFHVLCHLALSPLEKNLPLDLASNDGNDHEFTHVTNGQSSDLEAHGDVQTANAGGSTAAPTNGKATEPQSEQRGKPRSKLTEKVRPYIDSHFYQPKRNMEFRFPVVDYTHHGAFLNPAVTAQDPVIWLAKDRCGLSQKSVADNKAAGLRSSDDFAYFDEKNKLQWRAEDADNIQEMLDSESIATTPHEKAFHSDERLQSNEKLQPNERVQDNARYYPNERFQPNERLRASEGPPSNVGQAS